MSVLYRAMGEQDLEGIFAIYDDEALHGTATFDTAASTAASRAEWYARHRDTRYAVVVADANGGVAGWASLSPYSDRAAYARTAESSVYVHRDHRGRGIGRALMSRLLDAARASGVRVILARITAESTASLELHRSLGFRDMGTLHRCGEKFGRLLDVAFLELELA
jgi:phosphinothricin acetyltransferase